MGFDSFTSKELMNINSFTPTGSWPTDDVLVEETIKAMNATEGKSDFVYTITVEGHGDYPSNRILENPTVTVTGGADEASNNQWEYYVNMLHEVDDFIGDLISALDRRGEDTIVVFFGDHLPTMGLVDSDMKSGSIFKTKYITWNNMGLPKQDADLAAYQLLAETTNQLGIHEGTVLRYHQTHSSWQRQRTSSAFMRERFSVIIRRKLALKLIYPGSTTCSMICCMENAMHIMAKTLILPASLQWTSRTW